MSGSPRIDDEPAAPESASNGDFLAILLRRKWILFLITLVGVGLGYLNYSHTPPVYEARAQIVIIRKDAMRPTTKILDTDGGEDVVTRDHLSTQTVIIRSPMIVLSAVRDNHLGDLPSFANLDANSIAGKIIGGMAISRGGDTLTTEDANVLNVSYRGANPKDCKLVVDAVLASYQDSLTEMSQSVSQKTIDRISYARDTLHKDLTQKEAEYNEWRKNVPLIFEGKDKGSNIHAGRLSDIETRRSEVRLKLAETRAHTRTIEESLKSGVPREALVLLVGRQRGGGPNGNEGSRPQGQVIENQLFGLMIEEQLLIDTYGPDYPKVKVVRKQIQLLQDMMMGGKANAQGDQPTTPAQFLSVYLDSLRQEMKGLDEEDRELSEAFEKEREAAKESLNYELSDESKRAEIKRTNALFEQVVDNLSELKMVDELGGYSTRVIAEAVINGTPVLPIRTRSLSIGGVLGMIVGIALAYVIDLADKSFRTPDEIRGQLRLPVIGHIPVIEGLPRKQKKKGVENPESKIDEMIACFHRPRSTVAEAYRSIRTALYFGTRGEEHKVIQITSADVGDGKTTLAANLAVSIALSGKKVCLVDADFRRSRLHHMFGVDGSIGISSVIMGRAELTDAIRETEVENLSVLPCGAKPSNPSELLTSHRFKELLDVLRSKFDTILIDTPPLLAVTDPCAVAPRVDSVLLVMRITKNVRPNAQRAKEVLDALGAKVVGIVVNGVEIRHGYGHDQGYRRYGSGGYGYRDYSYDDYYVDEEDESIPSESLSQDKLTGPSKAAPSQDKPAASA
jgi:succinoglycan biosynthesis transport protein ExoP